MKLTVSEKMALARKVKHDQSTNAVTRQQQIKERKDRESEAARDAAKKERAYVKARPRKLKPGDSTEFTIYTLEEWEALGTEGRSKMAFVRDTDPNNHYALKSGGRRMPTRYRGALNNDEY